METVLTSIIAAAAAITVAVIEAKASKRRKQEDERHEQLMKAETDRIIKEDAMALGMKALLRSQIVSFYDMYHNQERPLSVERKKELDEMYEAYHALGGNGTISTMYKELENADIWIVR